MYKFILFTLLFMISLALGNDSVENQIHPISPDSLHLYIQPLSTDTFATTNLTIQSDGSSYSQKKVSYNDVRRARGWRAGGITMICVGATAIAIPGAMFTGAAIGWDFIFMIPASATIAAGTGMIIGGSKMIKKGNSIDGPVQVGVAPVVDPWNDRYGAQISLSF